MLDQPTEREVKNEDEENDQASTGKLVTLKKRTLLEKTTEQDVKYGDGGNDQASTENPVLQIGIFRFSNSEFAALRSWSSRRRDIQSIGGQKIKPILTKKIFKLTYRKIMSVIFSEEIEEDDPRIGQHRVLRIMWNGIHGTILLQSISLDTRNCILYMWTLFDQHGKSASIEPRTVWCVINFKLDSKEGSCSRNSSRKVRRADLSVPVI